MTTSKYLALLFVLLLVLLVFLPALRNDLLNWDDDVYVTQNQLVHYLSPASAIKIFSSFHMLNYHPLALLSYALEYNFFGPEPFIYHLDNLILHLLNCVLVFWLIFRLTNNLLVTLLVSVFFGIHPLHAESVVWVSERRDVLYSFFFLGALIAYLRYLKKLNPSYRIFSLCLFILACFTKAMAITLPLILLLIDYLAARKFSWELIREKLPFFCVSLTFGVLTAIARYTGGDLSSASLFNLYYNLCVASFSVLFYIFKMFIPLKLAAVYPYTYENISRLLPGLFFSPLVLAVLLIAVIYSCRHTRKVFFGFAFFLITIFPVIQILPSLTAWSVVSDRYFYLSSLGLFFLLAHFFFWLYSQHARILKAIVLIAICLLIAACSILTRQRIASWKDSVTLWTDVLENYPDCALAYNSRGAALIKQKEYQQAYRDLVRSVALDPGFFEAYFNLASLNNALGNYQQALQFCQKTLAIKADYLKTYNLLATIYGNMGEYQKAEAASLKAIQLAPDFAQAYCDLCTTYGMQGDFRRSISACRRAIQIQPDLGMAHMNLAVAYFNEKQYDLAFRESSIAQELGEQAPAGFLEELEFHRRQAGY